MDNGLDTFLNSYYFDDVQEFNQVLQQYKNKKIVIYGAGSYGIFIYNTLRKYGIKVSIFLDKSAEFEQKLFGIPVYIAEDPLLFDVWKKDAVVIVALVKEYYERNKVFSYIQSCGFKTIVDAQSIRCHLVDYDDKDNNTSLSNYISNKKDKIIEAGNLFCDNKSTTLYRRCIINHLSRIYSDYIESIGMVQYIPTDIKLYKGYDRFIDCGGYTGDTASQIIKIKGCKEIIIFEPNIELFKILSKNTTYIQNAYLYPCALSNTTKFMNMDYDGGSSALTNNMTDNFALSVRLDDVLRNTPFTFLKMDIEGAEYDALEGAQNLIKKYKPDLAISVYHTINHYWDIPLLLKFLVPSYEFYLRSHNSYTMETILYATTKEK